MVSAPLRGVLTIGAPQGPSRQAAPELINQKARKSTLAMPAGRDDIRLP